MTLSLSLLACPWDIGHIFHLTVKDLHWIGMTTLRDKHREEKHSAYVGAVQIFVE